MATSNKAWFVYVLECADRTLYTGVTTDVEQRFETHKSGEGAKYTKSHKPEKIVYTEKCENRSMAHKREMEIKKMKRIEKLQLIKK